MVPPPVSFEWIRGREHLGASHQEQVNCVCAAIIHSKEQRRAAVAVWDVDVEALRRGMWEGTVRNQRDRRRHFNGFESGGRKPGR